MRSRLMTAVLLACAAGGASYASATPVEDEAHRLDRLETRKLNERSAAGLAMAATPSSDKQGSGAGPALREREEQAIAQWRAATAACRAAGKPDDC